MLLKHINLFSILAGNRQATLLHKNGTGKSKNQATDRRWGNYSVKSKANLNQRHSGFSSRWEYFLICLTCAIYFFCAVVYWDKVFKNGSSKICGRQYFRYLKWYGLSKQFQKIITRNFRCSLLLSRSRLLFNKERNDVNRDLENYGKCSAHSCKTNSFMAFNKLQ